MPTQVQPRSTPKQIELRERNGVILDTARRVLLSEGYYALTMNRLADELGRSKPTIYEHFASKEDVLMGLAIEDAIQRWYLYERALEFQGRPRERMTAIGEFGARVFGEHLRIYEHIQPNDVREKASERQRQLLFDNEWRSHEIMTRVAAEAVKCGDLRLPAGMQPANVAYAIFCISLGGYLTEQRGIPVEGTGITNTMETVQWSLLAYLDGISWNPLWRDWDYENTIQRVRNVFDVDKIIDESRGVVRELRRQQEAAYMDQEA